MTPCRFGPPPYPVDSLNGLSRRAAEEVLRNIQSPDAIVGMCILAAMAITSQGLADVKLPTGQLRPLSLNFIVVAESGERKSTVDSLVFAPLYEHDLAQAVTTKQDMSRYELDVTLWEAISKGHRARLADLVRKGESTTGLQEEIVVHAFTKPSKPRARRVMRQNITPRAIMDALEGDGEAVAITTDEGQMMFKSDAMTQLGLLNKAWDGAKMISLDRADMDHVVVMNPRVTISIMTQKSVLDEYIDKHGSIAKGSGHWARYLPGWPSSTQGYRHVGDDEPTWESLPTFQGRMKDLLGRYSSAAIAGLTAREVLEFSDDAKDRWLELAKDAELMLRPGEHFDDINDFASKVMEIMGRVAAVMHYFSGDGGRISLETLERAKKIIVWHIHEYKRMFSPTNQPSQEDKDARSLLGFFRDRWHGSGTWVYKNWVLRNGPLRRRDRLNEALRILQYENIIWQSLPGAAGPRVIYLNDAHFGGT